MGPKKPGDTHKVCREDTGATCDSGYFLLAVFSLLILAVMTAAVNLLSC